MEQGKPIVRPIEFPGRVITDPEELAVLDAPASPDEVEEFNRQMAAIDNAEREAREESRTIFLR
jgi:hypothetical protein